MIKLTPDKNLRVQKIRVGRVPVLILRPAKQPDGNIGLLWSKRQISSVVLIYEAA